MKFIKTYKLFENNYDFNVGDYVKITGDYYDSEYIHFFEKEIGQITNISSNKDFPFKVTFFKSLPNLVETDTYDEKYVFYADYTELEYPNDYELDNYLKKYLSDEEYEEYEIKKDTKNFNL